MARLADRLIENLGNVRGRMDDAARRAGRDPADITLLIVTKYAPDEAVQALAALGPCELGESRPQQLIQRAGLMPDAKWHLIGHLQRNKVRALLPHVALIHSVDSLRLLERIDQIAGELGVRSNVLLEVNVSGEAAKDGFDPERLRSEWTQCAAAANVDLCGFMTMAPLDSDPDSARPVFQRLRELRDELQAMPVARPQPIRLSHLSMGMSSDFEAAIAEGATIVRIGSAIFEGIS